MIKENDRGRERRDRKSFSSLPLSNEHCSLYTLDKIWCIYGSVLVPEFQGEPDDISIEKCKVAAKQV